jgi:NDP-sugar pyrophosphorylase family protein
MDNLATTTAVILAGGVGSRLRSVVSDRPKVLASIHNRPFLAYLLDVLEDAGISEVVLCTGYMASLVEETFGATYGQMRLYYSRELTPLGTGGALRAAMPEIKADSALVMNGDSFCEVDLLAMAAEHHGREAEATLLLTEVPDTQRFGRVRIDDEGRLLAFEEKGAHRGPGWINAGVYLLDRHLLETIPENRAVSLEKEVFPAWIGRGLYGHTVRGRFLDIGTPQSFAEAEAFFSPSVEEQA